jgi:SAM-dependent methyltransferase
VGTLRTVRNWAALPLFRMRNAGKARFHCPICGYRGPFKDIAPETGMRRHALCPKCGALERHRFQYLALMDLLGQMDTRRAAMLHFAPEPFFRGFFASRFAKYASADLCAQDVDYRADIQQLPFADARYDFVFASHVLEHVADDARALAEIRRVLKPGGVAVLPVPIVAEKTVEYPAPNPHESGHVRAPGYDYFDRFEPHFARVVLLDSRSFPAVHQLFEYEDRSHFPSPQCPLRPAMHGERHHDIVPVCYV